MHIAGFSTDSRRLLFDSYADKLVPEDRNGSRDVFSRNFNGGSVTLLSHDASGRPATATAADTRIVGLSPRGGGEVIFMASEGVSFNPRFTDTAPALYSRTSWPSGVARYVALPASVADTTVIISASGQRAVIAPTDKADQGAGWSLTWLMPHDEQTSPLPAELEGVDLEIVGFGDGDHSLLVSTEAELQDSDTDSAVDVFRVPLP